MQPHVVDRPHLAVPRPGAPVSRKRLTLAVAPDRAHAPTPDAARMEAAVGELLAASGVDLTHPDLRDTAARVARLWREDFLAGYALDPAVILRDPVVGERDPEVVLLTGLRFHAMCPHHLLPYRGVAAVAYLPAGRLCGFGRIAQLIDCFTRRLTLQERATVQIAQALVDHLGARGAGCVLTAEQLCLALPGERHDASEVTTSAFVGEMTDRADLKARLLAGARPRRRRATR
jgi:GTP cyclohydrolase I